MRLIDTDELKQRIKEKLPMMSNWGEIFVPTAIEESPTIDAEPVVHCKNCVHNIERDGMKVCAILGRQTSNNFYCYYGVAKMDEEV